MTKHKSSNFDTSVKDRTEVYISLILADRRMLCNIHSLQNDAGKVNMCLMHFITDTNNSVIDCILLNKPYPVSNVFRKKSVKVGRNKFDFRIASHRAVQLSDQETLLLSMLPVLLPILFVSVQKMNSLLMCSANLPKKL